MYIAYDTTTMKITVHCSFQFEKEPKNHARRCCRWSKYFFCCVVCFATSASLAVKTMLTSYSTLHSSVLYVYLMWVYNIIALSLNGNKNVFKKYDTRRCSLQKRMSSTYCGRMAHASDKQTFYLRLTIGAMGKIREQSTNRHNGYYDKVCIIIIIYFFRNQ